MPIIFWGVAAGLAALGIGGGAALKSTGDGTADGARSLGDGLKIAAPIAAIGLAFYLSKKGLK